MQIGLSLSLVSTQICLTLELMPLNIKQKPVLKGDLGLIGELNMGTDSHHVY